MDTKHSDQHYSEQEIDLVDLVAVLWRRKVVVIGTMLFSIVVGAVFFLNKERTTDSTVVIALGEITKKVDGNEVVQKIMSTVESKQVLDKVFIPMAIKQVSGEDAQLSAALSGVIVVSDGDGDGESLVTISATTVDIYRPLVETVLNNSTNQLLIFQNKAHENHQARIQDLIAAKKLELKIQTDARRIESEKLSLKKDEFSNKLALEKNVNEELLRQEELKREMALGAANKKLHSLQLSITREESALKMHDEIIPILGERAETLREELASIETTRASLYEQFGEDVSPSTLALEALMAIDSRDGRYRDQINTLELRLAAELPRVRIQIETRLQSLASEIELAEQGVTIAKQEIAVFSIQNAYRTKELENTSARIDTEFDAFDASQEAVVLRLDADIVTLELQLNQSTPSQIIAPPTASPSSKTGLRIIGLVSTVIGGFFGCFLAFILEVVNKARLRLAESQQA